MYAVAIIADIFSLIPGVNFMTNIIAAILLGIIGSETGVNLYSPNAIGKTIATILIEAFPGLSALPMWTLRVYLGKKQVREEVGGI